MENAGGPDPRTEVTLNAKPIKNSDIVTFEAEFMVTGDT
jgi:hypothetical protein